MYEVKICVYDKEWGDILHEIRLGLKIVKIEDFQINSTS